MRLLTVPTHHGKAYALNMGVAAATGEVILFADARQRFAPDAVRALVANFADPEVGAVSGELLFEATDHAQIGKGLGFYWQYEKFLRKAESLSGSTVVCTGAIYAIRYSCFRPLPEGALVDDLLTPMRILLNGYRVVFEAGACAFDSLSPSNSHEFRRKVRTLAGNIQILHVELALLNPLRREPIWRYWSHMLLPRVLMPYCLMLLLLSNVTLAGPIFSSVLVLQLVMYGIGSIGLCLASRGGLLFRAASTFVLLNAASVVAAVQYALRPSHEMWRRQPS
ncbi:MAG: glycosyltransferase [Candidatus Methylomirabilis sp.]|nr:glycosyltransferase [Candidatus Methylomirabilis sp.]